MLCHWTIYLCIRILYITTRGNSLDVVYRIIVYCMKYVKKTINFTRSQNALSFNKTLYKLKPMYFLIDQKSQFFILNLIILQYYRYYKVHYMLNLISLDYDKLTNTWISHVWKQTRVHYCCYNICLYHRTVILLGIIKLYTIWTWKPEGCAKKGQGKWKCTTLGLNKMILLMGSPLFYVRSWEGKI